MESNFDCPQDEEEFYKSFGDILNLFDDKTIIVIQNAFRKRLGIVTSHPAGFVNDKVNAREPGKSGYINDEVINQKQSAENGKMYFEFIGNRGSFNNAINQHYMRHELMHIFETAAHDALSLDEKEEINILGIPKFKETQIGNREYAAING